jgi:glycosyltransferase involved in cell wall biosynthesis
MRVFFLTGEWTALRRFVRGQVSFPEGMPSVYRPWLCYKQRGYDVDVLMPGDFRQDATLDFQGCSVHLLARPRLLRKNKCSFFLFQLRALYDQARLYRRCLEVARRRRPDVIYCYDQQYIPAAWLLAKRCGSVFVKRFFGTWAYVDWFVRRGLKVKLFCILDFVRWLWPSDLLIVTDDGTAGDKVARLLRIPKEKFRFWRNGIDKHWSLEPATCLTIRSALGLTQADFVLMAVSRLDGWKRQDRVIRAMPIILKDVPHARLVIVGDGPERFRLEQMVQQADLQPYVRFTGMVEHNRVREFLSIADVFLQTNDVSCVGSSLLEAMVCARVVVTWDVGGTGEVVVDDVNGCLMPDAEPRTIARTVIALAADPKRRQRLAHSARQFALSHFMSWQQRLDMEAEAVERLCNLRKAAESVRQRRTTPAFEKSTVT